MAVADAHRRAAQVNLWPRFLRPAAAQLHVGRLQQRQDPETTNTVTTEITQISPFTFSASSDNTAVATVSTSGTSLIVESKSVGTAQITVTATDLDGVSVSQSFIVNVVFAPGRLLNISTRVNIGTE